MNLVNAVVSGTIALCTIPAGLAFAPQTTKAIVTSAGFLYGGLAAAKVVRRLKQPVNEVAVMIGNGDREAVNRDLEGAYNHEYLYLEQQYQMYSDQLACMNEMAMREWLSLTIEPEYLDWYLQRYNLVPPPPKEEAEEEMEQDAIDVTAQPVQTFTAQPMKSAVEWSDPQEVAPFVGFPVEDVALTIAKNSCDRNNASTIVLACPRGTGKTSLINAAIVRLSHVSEGNAQFVVFNGKHELNKDGSLKSFFCGLERDRDLYLDSGDAENSEVFLHRMTDIVQQSKNHRDYPLIAVCDEINNSLIATGIADQQNALNAAKGRSTSIESQIKVQESLLVTKGRSALVLGLITSHSPFVKDLGLSTAIQDSVNFVVCARADKLEAIHKALGGNSAIVKNPQVREKLAADFQAWEMHPQRDMEATIALTNICGGWRLVTLPRYDKEPKQFIHTPQLGTQTIAHDQPQDVDFWEEEPGSKKSGNGRFTQTYLDFIGSPEWRQKREQRLKVDGYECCMCKAKTDLQVDHKHYPPRSATFADFVNQPLSELRTLCRRCHQKETKRSRVGRSKW